MSRTLQGYSQPRVAQSGRTPAVPSPAILSLRDHPKMSCRGVRNWPPVWTQAAERGNKTAHGEVGILKHVESDERSNKRCFLVIEHEGERYIGALLFDDAIFCWLICHVLNSHLGWPIKKIADLDLSFSV